MTIREKWEKKFVDSLGEEEKKAFQLWLDFSSRKISEEAFKKKMDVNVMSRVLGKMNAARMNALEEEIEELKKRVEALEKKTGKK